jgi:hypothetical protein
LPRFNRLHRGRTSSDATSITCPRNDGRWFQSPSSRRTSSDGIKIEGAAPTNGTYSFNRLHRGALLLTCVVLFTMSAFSAEAFQSPSSRRTSSDPTVDASQRDTVEIPFQLPSSRRTSSDLTAIFVATNQVRLFQSPSSRRTSSDPDHRHGRGAERRKSFVSSAFIAAHFF